MFARVATGTLRMKTHKMDGLRVIRRSAGGGITIGVLVISGNPDLQRSSSVPYVTCDCSRF